MILRELSAAGPATDTLPTPTPSRHEVRHNLVFFDVSGQKLNSDVGVYSCPVQCFLNALLCVLEASKLVSIIIVNWFILVSFIAGMRNSFF